MIRILHVVGDSKFGGAGWVILGLAQMAQRQGWQVDVLTTDRQFQKVLRESGAGVVDIDVIWRKIRPLKDLSGLLALCRFLRSSDYDIVHTHTSKAGLIGRLAARFAHVPLIVHTVHGFAFREGSSRLAVVLCSAAEKVAARCCDHIVCVSKFHHRWALERRIAPADKMTAIPNGVSPHCVPPGEAVREVRQSLGLSEGDIFLLSMGRLAPQKGFEYLLEAVSKLGGANRKLRLVAIAGDGPLREQLEARVKNLGIGDTVRLLGFRDDIATLLAAADLVALPSLWEGLSIALLEAMAASKPIITTTIFSNLEVLGDSQAALLVPPADPQALANAISLCCRDESLRQRLARAAHSVFQASYKEDVMLAGYHEIYIKLLESKQLLIPTDSLPVALKEAPAKSI